MANMYPVTEEQALNAYRRMVGLRKLLGYVEDGSDTVVKLCQDDATGDYIVQVGKCNYYAQSFVAALDLAIADNQEN
jgi:hypothetical protein